MLYEYGIGTKWLELLKEIAPGVKRVAFVQTLGALAGPGQFGAMQGSAPALGVEVRPIRVGDAGERPSMRYSVGSGLAPKCPFRSIRT